MINITIIANFERIYKQLSEILRKQIKMTIKKLSLNPSHKTLNTKYYDKKKKLYESTVNNNCKLIWKFKSSKKKDIEIIDILNADGANRVLDKLNEFDKKIEKSKQSN